MTHSSLRRVFQAIAAIALVAAFPVSPAAGTWQVPHRKPLLFGRGGFWLQVGDRQVHVGTEDGVDHEASKAHLAYAVDNIHAWQTLFHAQGIAILDGVPIPGYARFEIRDPFGNRIEFIQSLEE